MSRLKKYLDNNFPDFVIRKPVFYGWTVGLRFELGLDLNGQSYFNNVIDRAIKLYESIVEDKDRILLIYQKYTGLNNKFQVNNFCSQVIVNPDKLAIEYEQLTQLYRPEDKHDVWTRAIIETTADQIDQKKLLTLIANSDFGDSKVQIEGETYIIDTTKNIIFHMYDDRGLDIIAKNKNSLTRLYHDFNDWILDHDRETIDKIFKNK